MDIGAARLLSLGLTSEDLSSELDSTTHQDLARLGPGRADVQDDDIFNPFAFPDLGGIADMPLLHHNANWWHRGVATMAVRCETLFITSNGGNHRIPRVLVWALAEYFHSLSPPPPVFIGNDRPLDADAGELVFQEAGCPDCHTPPLYSQSSPVDVDWVGTEAAATTSPVRGSGVYRVPSLRGVGHKAPYFHHGAVTDLESMFSEERLDSIPGHSFGTQLSVEQKAALISFLMTI
jgi:hypothetical protein